MWPALFNCAAQARPAGPEPITAFLAGANLGRLGHDPAFAKRVADNTELDLFDGNRTVVNSQHAGRFARGRANPAGEFGEVVGFVENGDGFLPAVAVNEIVPVGNDVAQRAAGVTERDAAIHAARALRLNELVVRVVIDLRPVVQPLFHRTAGRHLALDLQKSRYLSHSISNNPRSRPSRTGPRPRHKSRGRRRERGRLLRQLENRG